MATIENPRAVDANYRAIAIALAKNVQGLRQGIRDITASNPTSARILGEALNGALEAIEDEYFAATSVSEREVWESGRELDEAVLAWAVAS